MQLKKTLYDEALELPECSMILAIIDILNRLHVLFIGRQPAVDIEVILDRDHLGCEAINALEEDPTRSLEPTGGR